MVSITMNGHHDQLPPESPDSGKKNRIETQIHRRRKAKALSPLESEWDSSQLEPPSQLRMPPSPPRSPGSPKPQTEVSDRSVLHEALTKPKK